MGRHTHIAPHVLRCAAYLLFLSRDRKKKGNATGLVQSCLLPFRCGNSVTWVYDFRRGKQQALIAATGGEAAYFENAKASNRRHRCVFCFFWSSYAASCRGWPSPSRSEHGAGDNKRPFSVELAAITAASTLPSPVFFYSDVPTTAFPHLSRKGNPLNVTFIRHLTSFPSLAQRSGSVPFAVEYRRSLWLRHLTRRLLKAHTCTRSRPG